MNDLQRFFRYVIPGLIFIVLIALYLSLSLGLDFFSLFLEKIEKPMKSLNIGAAFTGLFALGAIGAIEFLFSIIHHFLFWNLYHYHKCGVAINHMDALKGAIAAGYLELRLPNGDQPSSELNRRGAWRAVSSLWHIRKESSLGIKGADGRIGGLSDLMHGAGATFSTSILALVFWVIIIFVNGVDLCWLGSEGCSLHKDVCWLGLTCFIAIVVIVLLWKNFQETAMHYQRILEMTLLTELRLEWTRKGMPAVLIVSQDDLEGPRRWTTRFSQLS